MSQSDLLHKVFKGNHGQEMREALEALERERVIKREVEHAPGRPPTTYWSLVAGQEAEAA